MAHLVAHDVPDLGQRALLEQVVVQRDARRAEEPSNVRTDAFRLARSVDFEHLRHRNVVSARQLQDRFADRSDR